VAHRLIAVADEAATTLVRTSLSPSCASRTTSGACSTTLAENTICIPSFNLTLGRTPPLAASSEPRGSQDARLLPAEQRDAFVRIPADLSERDAPRIGTRKGHRLQNLRNGQHSRHTAEATGATMPKKEIVTIDTATPNPNLSPATSFANLVFVAGQTGRHPTSGELGKDVREQTRNTLERIQLILQAAGTSLENVLTATTYLTNHADLNAYNEEYAKYFPTNKPARTTVTVASLNAPELLIEITVTACIPS
jgi:2-iminobutanoate/2-iminopropanoate deaminase